MVEKKIMYELSVGLTLKGISRLFEEEEPPELSLDYFIITQRKEDLKRKSKKDTYNPSTDIKDVIKFKRNRKKYSICLFQLPFKKR